jgi:hypothetical protein
MMATTARAGAYVDKMARVGASVQCVSRTVELFPTDMAEGVSIIAGVVRETKGVAQGLTLLLRGATSWLVLWLRESPLVSRKRRGPH